MRALIVLGLVVIASADKLGYNYQPVGHSSSGLSFAPGSGRRDLPGNSLGDFSSVSPSGSAPASNNAGFAQPSNVESNYQPSGPIAEPSADAPNYAAAQPELQKEFFTYTANEEDFEDPAASEKVSNSLTKALRVVFVKGPDNSGLEQAALALAKQAGQQETAIYVLNKQADVSDLANKLNAIRSNTNNKPEVHFVKYRTPEDAANAQRAIQGQYDQLGGASSNQDGGVAPVLNFASQAPALTRETAGEATSPGASYLPANILRRLRF